MAYPFIFESNFEGGVYTEWDTKTDTDGAVSFPNYRTLAAEGLEPFSGAHCMKLKVGLGTNDATVTEGDMNIAAAATAYVRFNMCIGKGFWATANNTINILEMQQAGATIEALFGMRIVYSAGDATDVINFGIGETAVSSWSTEEVERGVWYSIELALTVDNNGSDDGTIDLYVTKGRDSAPTAVSCTQVASLDQGAIGQGVFGVQGHKTTTHGTILLDNLVMDDARVYPQSARYPETPLLTKTAHAFVGSGKIDSITLLSGNGTDNVCKVYDTDVASTTGRLVAELGNTVTYETIRHRSPIHVSKGAYCVLSGTGPRALVQIAYAPHSAGAVRSLGSR